jgi:hypothetical protein
MDEEDGGRRACERVGSAHSPWMRMAREPAQGRGEARVARLRHHDRDLDLDLGAMAGKSHSLKP